MVSEQRDLVWREVGRIGTCMMVTHDGDGMRARPMVGFADRMANRVWFIADREQDETVKLSVHPRVCLAYADRLENSYVSLSGRAEVVQDRERLRAMWTPKMATWLDGGPDDDNAVLIAVTLDNAEVWDAAKLDFLVAVETLTAVGNAVADETVVSRDRAGGASAVANGRASSRNGHE